MSLHNYTFLKSLMKFNYNRRSLTFQQFFLQNGVTNKLTLKS